MVWKLHILSFPSEICKWIWLLNKRKSVFPSMLQLAQLTALRIESLIVNLKYMRFYEKINMKYMILTETSDVFIPWSDLTIRSLRDL